MDSVRFCRQQDLLGRSGAWRTVAGQRRFGENYVQEALAKIDALADLRGGIEWHLSGRCRQQDPRRGQRFDWVHSVDRLKLAERLSAQRPPKLAPLQVCLQVNISGEASKSGLAPADVPALAPRRGQPAPSVLRGLITIPEPGGDVARYGSRGRCAAARRCSAEPGLAGLDRCRWA